jgi:predicted nucleic acid-binding protein
MIVVVESNFVLELAFRQEEIAEAERILELASRRAIELVIPACALFEPFETLTRRKKERNATREKFRNEVRQLGRSQHFPDLIRTSEAVVLVLAESVETEAAALDRAILRILDCAQVIPLSDDVLRHSIQARAQFPFQPQDSVVFASVDRYVKQRGQPESIFANKNSVDFSVPEVEAHFADLQCKLLSTFASTVGVIEHRLSTRQDP